MRSKIARGVQEVAATSRTFAALRADGTVVNWGASSCGGDSTEVREQLADDNPLLTDDPAAGRVHRWLCDEQRLRAGYHDLSSVLETLDKLDHEISELQASLFMPKAVSPTRAPPI